MCSTSSLLLLTLSASSVLAATDCFTQIGVDYIRPANAVHRISTGLNFAHDCSNTTNDSSSTCTLSGDGYVTEAATLNITTTASVPKIFSTIRQNVDKPFNDTLTGITGSTLMAIHRNESGYIGFTTEMRCFAGTLRDCIGGDVKPGTAVEACSPTVLNDDFTATDEGFLTMDGTIAFVAASAEEVANMSTNSAAAKPEDTTSDGGHSGAGRMGLGVGAMAVVVAGAVFGLL
ncbi:MAG: hypothetical protein Q9195_006333 [Heterodermia aff. obscurata]